MWLPEAPEMVTDGLFEDKGYQVGSIVSARNTGQLCESSRDKLVQCIMYLKKKMYTFGFLQEWGIEHLPYIYNILRTPHSLFDLWDQSVCD